MMDGIIWGIPVKWLVWDRRHERDGSVEYYLSEPVVEDDPKAQGILMMACGEYMMLNRAENRRKEGSLYEAGRNCC